MNWWLTQHSQAHYKFNSLILLHAIKLNQSQKKNQKQSYIELFKSIDNVQLNLNEVQSRWISSLCGSVYSFIHSLAKCNSHLVTFAVCFCHTPCIFYDFVWLLSSLFLFLFLFILFFLSFHFVAVACNLKFRFYSFEQFRRLWHIYSKLKKKLKHRICKEFNLHTNKCIDILCMLDKLFPSLSHTRCPTDFTSLSHLQRKEEKKHL